MSYFLKKSYPSKKGLYLQIYESYYTKENGKRNRSYKSIGYEIDLIKQGINNPIEYYQEEVDRLNDKEKDSVNEISRIKNLGYFLPKMIFDYLDIDQEIDKINDDVQLSLLLKYLVYGQLSNSNKKIDNLDSIISSIFESKDIKKIDLEKAINIIGKNYQKIIEIINNKINIKFKRDDSRVFVDLSSFYFAVDIDKDWIVNSSFKLNAEPLLSKALVLDNDYIPYGMELYSYEKGDLLHIDTNKKILNAKYNNRLIHIGVKDLDVARKVNSVHKRRNEGYIYTKLIKGKTLSKKQKDYIDESDWDEIYDKNDELLYKYKVIQRMYSNGEKKDYGYYEYMCKDNENDLKAKTFKVKEKRIICYSPYLARIERAEILKRIDEVKDAAKYNQVIKTNLGEYGNYLNVETLIDDNKRVKIVKSINTDKLNADLNYCGYYILITSEVDDDPKDIIDNFEHIYSIKTHFKNLQLYLESNPKYVHDVYSIYGHFLVFYVCITILSLIRIKIFNKQFDRIELLDFIRKFNIIEFNDNTFINGVINSNVLNIVMNKLDLKIDKTILKKKDIDKILNVGNKLNKILK